MQTQKMINWYFIIFLYHTTCLAFYSFSLERGFRYKKYLLFNIIKLMETGLSDRNLNKRARFISRGVLREAENFSTRFCRLVERTCNRTAILHPLRPSRATCAWNKLIPFTIVDGFCRPLCLAQHEVSRTSLIIDLRQVVVKTFGMANYQSNVYDLIQSCRKFDQILITLEVYGHNTCRWTRESSRCEFYRSRWVGTEGNVFGMQIS